MQVAVSVIIASHRPADIRRCLDAVRPQMDDGAEAIVAADYDVTALAREFPWVRWVYLDDVSISAKRNAGARMARGGILAFIDDDCRACDGWMERGRVFLEQHPAVDAVEGHTMVPAPASDRGLYREFRRLETRGFRTNNIFYRKQAFDLAGGFDERFTVQREDIDLAFGVMERGGEIAYDDGLCVEHPVRSGERWDLLKNCWNRRFDPLLHRKHPESYRHYIGSPFPRSVGIAGLAHVAVVAAAMLGWWAGAACCAADAALLAALVVRRDGWLAPRAFAGQWLSWLLAPVVLTAALIHGSVRFRTVLVV